MYFLEKSKKKRVLSNRLSQMLRSVEIKIHIEETEGEKNVQTIQGSFSRSLKYHSSVNTKKLFVSNYKEL